MNPTNGPTSPWNEYADLDGWGAQAAPQHQFALSTDSLPNGAYDCEITGADLTRAQNHRILRVQLKAGGLAVEHTYWLNRQEAVNGFLAEMAALGFPAHTWGGGPGQLPLSQAIPSLIPQLKGLKFRANKSSREDTRPEKKGTIYHEFRIAGRIAGAPMPTLAPVRPSGPPVAAGQDNAYDPSDCPF